MKESVIVMWCGSLPLRSTGLHRGGHSAPDPTVPAEFIFKRKTTGRRRHRQSFQRPDLSSQGCRQLVCAMLVSQKTATNYTLCLLLQVDELCNLFYLVYPHLTYIQGRYKIRVYTTQTLMQFQTGLSQLWRAAMASCAPTVSMSHAFSLCK